MDPAIPGGSRQNGPHLMITIGFAKAGMIAVTILLAVSTAGAQSKSDDLKQQILSQAQSADPDRYAFIRTTRVEQISKAKTETHTTVEKFDPKKSGDARWTLVSMDGGPPAADVLSKYNKGAPKRLVPGYYRLAKYFAAPATASTDSRGRTVFHFDSLPKDSAIVLDTDVSSNATADVTIREADGTTFAEQVRLNIKPTRLKLIIKLERYESTFRYRLGPEGNPILVEQVADTTALALGQGGSVHTVITYSDYRAVK